MTDAREPLSVRDVPGLGERRAKALKIAGATDWWFYPLILVVAVALVLVSLGGDIFDRSASPQPAAREAAAFVYGADALADGIKTADGHMLHALRDFGVSTRAVRIGVRPGMGGPSPATRGALLLMTPADAALLAGRPVHVEVSFKRINVTTAAGLAASLQSDGPVVWSIATTPSENGVIAFDLPASAGPLKGLGLWVMSDKADYNYGLEISRVVVSPAG